MTPDEISDYSRNVRDLSATDRELFLRQHKQRMDLRARDRGFTLRDTAPNAATGMTSEGVH